MINNTELASITVENLAIVELPPTEMEVEISLYEAKKGTNRILSIKDPALCPECANVTSGIRRKCFHCRGQGYVHTYRQVEIVLPPGLLAGEKVSFPKLGRYNLCAERNSDLIVKIKIWQHPYLELVGKNIACTLVVPFFQAMFGKKISVPTVGGKAQIRLHPFTISGKIYRLKGYGLAGGDQLINVEVLPWQKSSQVRMDALSAMNCGNSNDAKRETLSLPHLNSRVSW